MRNRRNVLALAVMTLLSAAPLTAQEAPAAVQPPVGGAAPARPAPPPSKPTPHWPDGRVNIGAPLGESGIWAGDGRLAVNPEELRTELDAQRADSHRPDSASGLGARAH